MISEKQSIRYILNGTHGVRISFAIALTIAAAACTPPAEPTHQTVDYYLENKEARAAKLVECENDPGALGQTPDCINAKQAARRDMKSLRDLAPLNLPGSTPSDVQRDADKSRSSEKKPSGNK